MLARTGITLAVLALAAPGVAAAEPAQPPTVTQIDEQPVPEGGTPFADNPAIVSPHPQQIDSWHRLPDPRSLGVSFTTGTPQCFGVHAEVQETPDIIAVKLRSGSLPEAVDRACIAIAVFGTLTAPLDSPVGDRAIVSIT
jgi:hypothetical protein